MIDKQADDKDGRHTEGREGDREGRQERKEIDILRGAMILIYKFQYDLFDLWFLFGGQTV